ncbi:predicted protein [Histoplasma capsulatum var. duboisii H88]|uniref:Predicted protein n=1 Tax=Ajellomyces capsulatus (strain H88) TaxID=544711 RepID=F0U9W9_AJEC8|nr:predicted protein [Histoplasma capsulatum var. duboisii H88]
MPGHKAFYDTGNDMLGHWGKRALSHQRHAGSKGDEPIQTPNTITLIVAITTTCIRPLGQKSSITTSAVVLSQSALICVDSCHCLRIRELASRQQSLQPKPNLLNRTQLLWDRIQVYAPDVGRCFGCARYSGSVQTDGPGPRFPPLLDLEILSIVR